MTRKDYERIAWDCRQLLAANPGGAEGSFRDGVTTGIKLAYNQLCDALKADNHRFDEDKFLRACGIES